MLPPLTELLEAGDLRALDHPELPLELLANPRWAPFACACPKVLNVIAGKATATLRRRQFARVLRRWMRRTVSKDLVIMASIHWNPPSMRVREWIWPFIAFVRRSRWGDEEAVQDATSAVLNYLPIPDRWPAAMDLVGELVTGPRVDPELRAAYAKLKEWTL